MAPFRQFSSLGRELGTYWDMPEHIHEVLILTVSTDSDHH